MINDSLAKKVIDSLKERNLSLGAVESLTGGLFSSTVSGVPGASKAFIGSIISYSPRIKEEFANVYPEDISKYGVVSEEVAIQMAKGGKRRLGVDLCVSFTGNAGPTSEPGGAPVGRVYMAIASNEGVKAYRFDFKGERNEVREASVNKMLELLIEKN